MKKKYTEQDLINNVIKSKNCSDLLKMLGLRPAGGNFFTMQKEITRLNLDISHWGHRGRNWNKGLKLKSWENYRSSSPIKKHLIKHLCHQCEDCKLTEWKNQPISLELHHIDGDRTNNCFMNLSLLCPNCHSYTNFYRGKNINTGNTELSKRIRTVPPIMKLQPKTKIYHVKPPKQSSPPKPPKEKRIHKTKIDWPSKEILEDLLRTQSMSSIARSLGVSDGGLRGHAIRSKIDVKSISLWSQRHGDSSLKWRKV